MSVYVDDMFKYAMGRYGRMRMSHMIADTEQELHAMARRISVARKWYQGDHYDIAMSKRVLAVQHGAVEITLRQCAVMVANRRAGWPMGDPESCVEISRHRVEVEQFLKEVLGG